MGKMYYSCAIYQLIMILLIIMEFAICSSFSNNTTTFSCIAREKKALLKLKASFTDPFNTLSSWNNTTESNCCAWQGVTCDKITRHVISLHLRNADPYSSENKMVSNQLDSSLSELKYLNHLDVSGNDFQQSPIPTFLGSMKQLQHLNLSFANFSGVVPHHLGNLSSLRVLDLNNYYRSHSLMVDDLKWASNLSRLEHLDLSDVDLSRTKHLSEVIFNMLPSILVLRLSETQLNNTHLPHACVNSSLLTNIQHLDLSYNSFYGEFPCFLYNMTSLRVLDLSINQYNSSGPYPLIRLRNLVHLDLSLNSLHHKADWISEFLSDKCHLKSLNLAYNNFYGDNSGVFKNLSMGCWTHKFETLDLRDNKFYGDLPEELGELKQLNYLDLSRNAFTGPIPTSLGKLRALRYLSLFENKLSGPIPTSLSQLSNLEWLALYNNPLNSTLSQGHFAKLSKLEYLRVSSINFSVNFDWVPPFQLKYLHIDSSNIGGQFPQWLQTQKSLQFLYMSDCSILGTLPIKWFHSMKNLLLLDLSHNHIKGPISDPLCQLKGLHLLDLSKNNFAGNLPDCLCQLKGLSVLDLSKNHFSGNLPDCLGTLQDLQRLKLSFNKLSGVIPNSMGESGSLYSLILSSNRLQGQLPSTLKNCEYLETLDVEENMLSGDLPEWIGTSLNSLKFLRLGKNEFHGVIPSTFCRLSNLQVMDLANNKLAGHIPHCFDNLLGMVKETHSSSVPNGLDTSLYQVIKGVEMEYTNTLQYLANLDLSSNDLVGEIPQEVTSLSGLIGLNLSHNHLAGKIPRNIGDMNSLTSLDLSNNKLCGAIPNSLSDLNFLEFLKLSHNNLSGKIPTGNQLQTLNEPSIYEGNPGLCGYPLLKECLKDEALKSLNAEDQGDKVEKIIFFGVIASGFATGFWGIIGVLVLKTSWRHAFFQFSEAMIRKMLGL